MNNRLVSVFLRWGLLCSCIGLVGGAGVVMAGQLSMHPLTALTFAIAIAALGCVTSQMGKITFADSDIYDVVISLIATGSFLIGIVIIVFLAIVMLAITGSIAHIAYFILVLAEWVFVNVFW